MLPINITRFTLFFTLHQMNVSCLHQNFPYSIDFIYLFCSQILSKTIFKLLLRIWQPRIDKLKSYFFFTHIICGTLCHLQLFLFHTICLHSNFGCIGTLEALIELFFLLPFKSFNHSRFVFIFAYYICGWTLLKLKWYFTAKDLEVFLKDSEYLSH